jgi:hypothetical protein
MRLIVEVTKSDGCTYWTTSHIPIIFSSKEEFIILLEEECIKSDDEYDQFGLGGQTWYPSEFIEDGEFCAPSVYTVDEFFAEVEAHK